MQSPGLSHRSRGAARPSCHRSQLSHIFMCALPTTPAISSMSVPGEPSSSATGSSAAAIRHCKNQHGADYRWRPCALVTPSHTLCQSLAGWSGKDLSSGVWNNIFQSQLGLLIVEMQAVGLTPAPFAQTEVEMLVLMLNEQDTSHSCSVYTNVPVDAFQNI